MPHVPAVHATGADQHALCGASRQRGVNVVIAADLGAVTCRHCTRKLRKVWARATRRGKPLAGVKWRR